MFPDEIMLHEHDVQIKFWTNGIVIRTNGITCKMQPFCEQIDSYLCMNRLANPECGVITIPVIMGLNFISFPLSLLVLLNSMKYLCKGIILLLGHVVKFCIMCVFKLFKKPKEKIEEEPPLLPEHSNT